MTKLKTLKKEEKSFPSCKDRIKCPNCGKIYTTTTCFCNYKKICDCGYKFLEQELMNIPKKNRGFKMTKLKTKKEIIKDSDDAEMEIYKTEEEIIKWFKNLQSPETEYPTILKNFPDDMKGEIAKDNWNKTMFTYGAEYGMLAFIYYFFNLTGEDLKRKKIIKALLK